MASTNDLAWLAGPTDLARLLHVKVATLTAWSERQSWNGFPDKLEIATAYSDNGLIRGPLYDAREVIRWHHNWKPIKGPKHPKLGYVDPALLKQLGIEPSPQGANNGQQTEN